MGVYAIGDTGAMSAISNLVFARTLPETPNIYYSTLKATSVKLDWTSVSNRGCMYRITYRDTSSSLNETKSTGKISRGPYTLTNLKNSTTYEISIVAVERYNFKDVTSAASASSTFKTNQNDTPVSTTKGVDLVRSGSTAFEFCWDDV